jgi:hypothetical protein
LTNEDVTLISPSNQKDKLIWEKRLGTNPYSGMDLLSGGYNGRDETIHTISNTNASEVLRKEQ